MFPFRYNIYNSTVLGELVTSDMQIWFIHVDCQWGSSTDTMQGFKVLENFHIYHYCFSYAQDSM